MMLYHLYLLQLNVKIVLIGLRLILIYYFQAFIILLFAFLCTIMPAIHFFMRSVVWYHQIVVDFFTLRGSFYCYDYL